MNTQMLAEINPELQMAGAVVSIIIAVILVGVGVYAKKQQKNWWSISVLLGLVAIVVNAFQLII